jgi:hypothetical protein
MALHGRSPTRPSTVDALPRRTRSKPRGGEDPWGPHERPRLDVAPCAVKGNPKARTANSPRKSRVRGAWVGGAVSGWTGCPNVAPIGTPAGSPRPTHPWSTRAQRLFVVVPPSQRGVMPLSVTGLTVYPDAVWRGCVGDKQTVVWAGSIWVRSPRLETRAVARATETRPDRRCHWSIGVAGGDWTSPRFPGAGGTRGETPAVGVA